MSLARLWAYSYSPVLGICIPTSCPQESKGPPMSTIGQARVKESHLGFQLATWFCRIPSPPGVA